VAGPPLFAQLISASFTALLANSALGNSAPAARTWTGTRLLAKPSPRPLRPCPDSDPSPSHQRAIAPLGGWFRREHLPASYVV
jgi:hypothetical protein